MKKKINPFLEGAEIVTTIFTGEEDRHIWMLGDNSIGIVNTDTMVHDLITNFFGQDNDILPVTVISSLSKDKYIGLYISKDGEIWFVFLRESKGMLRKLQTDILGEGKFFLQYI